MGVVQSHLRGVLDSVSTERFLLENGVSIIEVDALRMRLLEPGV